MRAQAVKEVEITTAERRRRRRRATVVIAAAAILIFGEVREDVDGNPIERRRRRRRRRRSSPLLVVAAAAAAASHRSSATESASLRKYESITAVTSTIRTISKSLSNSDASWALTASSLRTRLAGRMSMPNSTYRSSRYGLFLLHPPCPRPRRFADTIMTSFGCSIMSRNAESHSGWRVTLIAPDPW